MINTWLMHKIEHPTLLGTSTHVQEFKDGDVSFNSPVLFRNAHKMFNEVFHVI